MLKVINEFTEQRGVSIPSEYRQPFLKSWELFNKNRCPSSKIKRRSRFNQPESLCNMINGEVQEKFHTVYYNLQNAKYLQKLARARVLRYWALLFFILQYFTLFLLKL